MRASAPTLLVHDRIEGGFLAIDFKTNSLQTQLEERASHTISGVYSELPKLLRNTFWKVR